MCGDDGVPRVDGGAQDLGEDLACFHEAPGRSKEADEAIGNAGDGGQATADEEQHMRRSHGPARAVLGRHHHSCLEQRNGQCVQRNRGGIHGQARRQDMQAEGGSPYIHTDTYIHTVYRDSMYVHACIMHVYIHKYICVHTEIVCTYIHTYIHACMHACMHTYIHTYINIVANHYHPHYIIPQL